VKRFLLQINFITDEDDAVYSKKTGNLFSAEILTWHQVLILKTFIKQKSSVIFTNILLICKYGFQYLFSKLKFSRFINFVHVYFKCFADGTAYFSST